MFIFLRVLLFDHDNFWELARIRAILLVQLVQFDTVGLLEVVGEHSVVVADAVTEVAVNTKRLLMARPKIRLPNNIQINLLKPLLYRCPRIVHVRVNFIKIEDHELSEALSAQEGAERVLPVCLLINLIRLHGPHIHHVHKLRYLVHQDQRANSSQVPR